MQLSAQYRLYSSIKEQIEALLGGFYEIIPKDLVNIVSITFGSVRKIINSAILYSSTNRS